MSLKPVNFGPGPAKLPDSVIHQIQKDIVNWENTGLSILEVGHRSAEFKALIAKIQADVKRLLAVPDEFAIIFLPAGAQNQFAIVNMNLIGQHKTVNYLDTGYWSKKAISEAKKYAEVNIVASGSENHYHTIPDQSQWTIDKKAAFLHYTDNETIGGLEFPSPPVVDNMLLVSDMSSNIFSRPFDFSPFACLYACAQKNMGIAGMSLVIVRKDLLNQAHPLTPNVFNYTMQYENDSSLCTPPVFAFYVSSLMFDWIDEQGGVEVLDERNKEKSSLLYEFIDQSKLYHNPIAQDGRSRMNVPFTLSDEALDSVFLSEAKKNGLLNLKGHRSVGGMRASIYNAMHLNEIKRLLEFMEKFERQHG